MSKEKNTKPSSVPYGDTQLSRREKALIGAHVLGVTTGVGTTIYASVELVRGNFIQAAVGAVLVAGEAAVMVVNAKKTSGMIDRSTRRQREQASSLPRSKKEIR